MELSKIVTGVVLLLVGVILVSALVIPTIGDVQKISGDKVTYTNPQNSTNPYHYDYVDSVDCSMEYMDGAWDNHTVNGTEIDTISDAMFAIVSDGMSLQINANGSPAPVIPSDPFVSSPTVSASEGTLNVTFNNGTWTVTGGTSGVIATGSYTWVVTYVDDGRYIARNGNPANFYNSGSPSDFIMYSSTYTTGDLDTYYAYGGGKMTLGVSGYTGVVNLTNTPVSGTTDVYQCSTCNVTITDTENDNSETFTPYRCLVKETIEGHKASGTAYTLFGLIPLLLIVSLVLVPVGLIAMRSYFGRSD